MVNWPCLRTEDISLENDEAYGAQSLRNFIILTALKLQELMADLKKA